MICYSCRCLDFLRFQEKERINLKKMSTKDDEYDYLFKGKAFDFR